jgi:hypothetical protein
MNKIIKPILVSLLGLSLACASTVNKAVDNTCTGTYPAYWQDIDPKFSEMWEGQSITNAPTEGWDKPIFKLSDNILRH